MSRSSGGRSPADRASRADRPSSGSAARASRTVLPARRAAALGAAVAFAAGTAALAWSAPAAATPAPAGTFAPGTATATVLRADLDVSALTGSVQVPVHASLNDVHAPGDARETALTVTVGHGMAGGHPVDLLRASAATANATVDNGTAEGYANVVDARVHLPGLPLLSLVSLDAATSRATCKVGHAPTATSELVGVRVLGRRVAVNAVGTTAVNVPGVGRVDLAVTQKVVTSATAAATALHLSVHVNPLSLGVADVSGDVTIARAACTTPQAGGTTSGGSTNGATTSGGTPTGSGGTSSGTTSSGTTTGSTSSGGTTTGSTSSGAAGGGNTVGGSVGGGTNPGATSGSSGTSGSTDSTTSGGTASAGGTSGVVSAGASGGVQVRTQTVGDSAKLAQTGASSTTPYLAAGAVALVVAGGGAVLVARRRRGRDADA